MNRDKQTVDEIFTETLDVEAAAQTICPHWSFASSVGSANGHDIDTFKCREKFACDCVMVGDYSTPDLLDCLQKQCRRAHEANEIEFVGECGHWKGGDA